MGTTGAEGEETAKRARPHADPKRRERNLRRRIEYLTALHETSLRLVERLDRSELLEAILERATALTNTAHGYVYLLTPGGREMKMQVGKGFFSRQLGLRVRPGKGLGGKVWQSGRPLVVDDYARWTGRLPNPGLDRLCSAVGIPLKSARRVEGVIGLGTVDTRRRFGREDLEILGRFAELAVVALENARLYAELRRELTERLRVEGEIRASERRYRNLLESSPDPIVVYDMAGNATYVNPAFEQTFGWTQSELLGRHIDFVPEANREETRAAIARMLRGDKIQLFETRRYTQDGRTLEVQLSSTLFTGPDGRRLGNIVILRDTTAYKRTQEEVRRYHEQLADLVEARTAELAETNRQLALEVEERKRAEAALKKRERELEAQSHHLEEVNTALKVLLKQREMDKKELGETVLANIRQLVTPYLEKLQRGRLSTDQAMLVGILGTNLDNILSPFVGVLSSRLRNLTPTEIRVANLVREGRTNKEIAALLLLSKNTVLFHRYNIRRKLGLTNQKVNLRSYLSTIEK